MATGWKLGPLGGSLTDIRNLGINLLEVDGWDSFPAKRADNPEISYSDGAFSDPRKWYSGRELPLKVVLLDSDATGGVTHPEGREGHLRANIDTLLGLLNVRNNFLSLRKDVPAPASVGGRHEREAVCEVVNFFGVDQSLDGGVPREGVVLFDMIEAFWRQIETTGTAAPQKTTGVAGVTTTSQGFNVVTGGNAPVRGGIAGAFEIEFTANSAITNPRLEVDATGEFISYAGTVPAGDSIIFDVGAKTLVIDDSGTLTRADSGRSTQHAWWIDLDPASTIAVTASVSVASDFDCDVRWYDRWF